MKTNHASGFALAVAVVVIAACSGDPADVTYGPDGGIVTGDGAITSTTPDTGHPSSTPDTGSVIPPGVDATTGTPDTGVTPPVEDTGAPPPATDSGSTAGTCPSTCAQDTDCSATCPTVPGGVYCCDNVTTSCYQSATATCPDQMTSGTDSGGGGY